MLDGVYFEEGNFTVENETDLCSVNHKMCVKECLNYKAPKSPKTENINIMITLRQEPWVLAVLVVATLGFSSVWRF